MKNNKLILNLRIINLFLVGILAGAMLEEFFFFKVIVMELPKELWTTLHSRFGIFHPYTIIPIAALATFSLIIILIIERKVNSAGKRITWWSALFFLAIILLTSLVMMPLNFTIMSWKATGIPDNWVNIRDKWTLYQGLRTVFNIIGFILLIIAAQIAARTVKLDKPLT